MLFKMCLKKGKSKIMSVVKRFNTLIMKRVIVKRVWKHCVKRRNCSLSAIAPFQQYFQYSIAIVSRKGFSYQPVHAHDTSVTNTLYATLLQVYRNHTNYLSTHKTHRYVSIIMWRANNKSCWHKMYLCGYVSIII